MTGFVALRRQRSENMARSASTRRQAELKLPKISVCGDSSRYVNSQALNILVNERKHETFLNPLDQFRILV